MWDFMKSACCLATIITVFALPVLPSIIDAIRGRVRDEED